jgi:hypothetical protein
MPSENTIGHNLQALNNTIVSGFNGLLKIDRKIEAARTTHMKPLTDERTKLRRELKADTDIDGKDITLLYNIYRREKDASQMDEEDANRVADNQLTLFNALVDAGQLDFANITEDFVPASVKAAAAEIEAEGE